MPVTTEQYAIEALRMITKLGDENPAVRHARHALEQIEIMSKPTVHNLSAADVIIDKPPGGGA